MALTIAGSDSGGGAGIQADLHTFAAHRVHGTSVVTAITAQNTRGVTAAESVGVDLVRAQLDAVLGDFSVVAVKTGMLGGEALLALVAQYGEAGRLPNLVVDPVMVTTTGDSLFSGDPAAYLARLGPLATVLTPNLIEARQLLGREITTVDDMREAARALATYGPRAVLVKGGHREEAASGPAPSGGLHEDALASGGHREHGGTRGSDEPGGARSGRGETGGAPRSSGEAASAAGDSGSAIDVLWCDGQMLELAAPRVATRNDHGTGCTLASAIAARLALGHPLPQAVSGAKAYVTEALRAAADWRLGLGPGPVDHHHAHLRLAAIAEAARRELRRCPECVRPAGVAGIRWASGLRASPRPRVASVAGTRRAPGLRASPRQRDAERSVSAQPDHGGGRSSPVAMAGRSGATGRRRTSPDAIAGRGPLRRNRQAATVAVVFRSAAWFSGTRRRLGPSGPPDSTLTAGSDTAAPLTIRTVRADRSRFTLNHCKETA
ncbi:bifunctional hydroxymethylpyrimidine kinase/phosphomethylpyrimidine kinase [Glycomyces tritici]|uniref:Bifunctional hydroxymethylpyrimidine kinase/phosphomethylpyrimidine kinase n=1 Tax=Glycomyces tritici TaxID=2665176 RepID=A0ABT7YMR7_9ACTN|nr:bifunctional hydroxymethylpyrimidine kinase/phosphomethylpyrimidine kinase [Glycomyces tritici]MDN3239931.1 bifunctional hydroxymethylpyrimidine kinase/phosphomethylpyrimidine kinase [Glycomyces tritici]